MAEENVINENCHNDCDTDCKPGCYPKRTLTFVSEDDGCFTVCIDGKNYTIKKNCNTSWLGSSGSNCFDGCNDYLRYAAILFIILLVIIVAYFLYKYFS